MSERLRLAVFISGRGSNMEALIEACAAPDFPAEISVVLSNKPDAQGLNTARDHGLATLCVDHTLYDTKAAFEAAMVSALAPHAFDLICLAGFMRLLSGDFIDQFPERIINIHPSLLPAYKGLDTHARALAGGATQAGCSVHYVVPEMDSGEIIVQRSIDIAPNDTPETLGARVLAEEHIAYPEAVRIMADKLRAS